MSHLAFSISLKGYSEVIKVFQQSGILPVRAKVIPMWNDAWQACPFLFLCSLFVSQLVVAQFSPVHDAYRQKVTCQRV